MTITPEQFAAIAPHSALATRKALFAPNRDGQVVIQRILDEHGITEPPAVAQFLACVSLASNGFTQLDKPIDDPNYAPDWLPACRWLGQCAREWWKANLTSDALDWDWEHVVSYAGAYFGIPQTPWLTINNTLSAVCRALGVSERVIDE